VPRLAASLTAIRWSIALLEGCLASLVVVLAALVYHVTLMQVPFEQAPVMLYGPFAALVGLVYGGFSVVAAMRFLARPAQSQQQLAGSALGWTAAFAVALFGAYILGLSDDLSRISMISAYFIGLPVLLVARGMIYSGLAAQVMAGRLQYRQITVIGNRADVDGLVQNGKLWQSGYRVASVLYFETIRDKGGRVEADQIAGFAQRWLARGAEDVVLVGALDDVDGLERIINGLKRFAINVYCAPASGNARVKFLDVAGIGPTNAVQVLAKPMGDGAVLLKRSFDLVAAGLGLVFLAPFFLILAVLIQLDSPGPVFYRQERRGFNGESFYIWKFRSMRVTESGRQMTQVRVGDSRITRVGRFIRAASIDELPQLINVVQGQMSLVGPRPHAIVHDDELGEQLASYAHRQRIKPGITGWAQVNGFRGETTTFAQIEGRTEHDLYYIENWSIFLDWWIIFLTVFSPKTRQNAV
jgi:Undecaprenyl-phosphate glucose phosphotransferase